MPSDTYLRNHRGPPVAKALLSHADAGCPHNVVQSVPRWSTTRTLPTANSISGARIALAARCRPLTPRNAEFWHHGRNHPVCVDSLIAANRIGAERLAAQ